MFWKNNTILENRINNIFFMEDQVLTILTTSEGQSCEEEMSNFLRDPCCCHFDSTVVMDSLWTPMAYCQQFPEKSKFQVNYMFPINLVDKCMELFHQIIFYLNGNKSNYVFNGTINVSWFCLYLIVCECLLHIKNSDRLFCLGVRLKWLTQLHRGWLIKTQLEGLGW